jgi:hypothetical protein
MRHSLLGVLIAIFVIALAGTVAATGREVTVTPIESSTPTPLLFGPTSSETACQVGNLNPPAWAISNFVLPPEEYKLAFDPLGTCATCQIGFSVSKIHALLQFAAACEVTMSVDVEEAIYPSVGCPAPGPVLCGSLTYTVTVPAAGLYDIGLPLVCDCLDVNRSYLLSVHFLGATCTPDLITDAGPAATCRNWNNYGAGWYDLFGAYPTWPGQLVFFADADCCSGPVPVNDTTWGAVKQLYE